MSDVKDMTTNAFERHAQTALVLLLVALLLWVGQTTQQTAVSVAEMRVELAFLKAAHANPHKHPELDAAIALLNQRCSELEKKQ